MQPTGRSKLVPASRGGARKSRRPNRVAAQAAEHPEIGEPLRALFVGFENRTFLPQLRDVQRFLDRVGAAHGKLKSRSAAAPLLIRALGKLRPDELARLTDKPTNDSEYSLLARAIMGTQAPPKPPDTSETK